MDDLSTNKVVWIVWIVSFLTLAKVFRCHVWLFENSFLFISIYSQTLICKSRKILIQGFSLIVSTYFARMAGNDSDIFVTFFRLIGGVNLKDPFGALTAHIRIMNKNKPWLFSCLFQSLENIKFFTSKIL